MLKVPRKDFASVVSNIDAAAPIKPLDDRKESLQWELDIFKGSPVRPPLDLDSRARAKVEDIARLSRVGTYCVNVRNTRTVERMG